MKVSTCKYCNKEFENKKIGGHTGHCKSNPKFEENNKKVSEKGRSVLEKLKLIRIEEYNLTPKKCSYCNKDLNYRKQHKKYCNSSCAAKHNNTLRKGKKRIFSAKGLENIKKANKEKKYFFSNKNLETIKLFEDNNIPYKRKFRTNIKIINCKICDKLFTTKNFEKSTCSSECKTIASFSSRKYHNGKKHYTRYFNKWVNSEVILESSWEVKTAEKLDELNIKWERPKCIKWRDSNNIDRVYFPDFYLNDFDIYLDPKNPYCMKLDAEKMKIISEKVNIEFGNIEKIIEFISNLTE